MYELYKNGQFFDENELFASHCQGLDYFQEIKARERNQVHPCRPWQSDGENEKAPETKRCKACEQDVALSGFRASEKHAGELQANCIVCNRKRHKGIKVKKPIRPKGKKQQKAKPTAKNAISDGIKRCSRCGSRKPIEEFSKSGKARNGLRPSCRRCAAIIARQYYRSHKDAMHATGRRWRKEHPQRARLCRLRRRAREKHAAGAEYTKAHHIEARWEMWGGNCYICGSAAEATDHVIPLAMGGSAWPANLRPICTSCNSTKGTKPLSAVIVSKVSKVSNTSYSEKKKRC